MLPRWTTLTAAAMGWVAVSAEACRLLHPETAHVEAARRRSNEAPTACLERQSQRRDADVCTVDLSRSDQESRSSADQGSGRIRRRQIGQHYGGCSCVCRFNPRWAGDCSGARLACWNTAMMRSFVDETRSAANSERFHCCRVSARFCEEWLFLTEKPHGVQRSGIHHSETALGGEQWRRTAERRPFESESA